MSFRFEGLEIWQRARRFSQLVDSSVTSFPQYELYGLRSQITRAANAVVLLIAEGAGLPSKPLFCHRLSLAVGEVFEVSAAAILALDRKYITSDIANQIYEEADALSRKISRFKRTIR
jgi:four helix bundle protein